jgi:hypothetical protein
MESTASPPRSTKNLKLNFALVLFELRATTAPIPRCRSMSNVTISMSVPVDLVGEGRFSRHSCEVKYDERHD